MYHVKTLLGNPAVLALWLHGKPHYCTIICDQLWENKAYGSNPKKLVLLPMEITNIRLCFSMTSELIGCFLPLLVAIFLTSHFGLFLLHVEAHGANGQQVSCMSSTSYSARFCLLFMPERTQEQLGIFKNSNKQRMVCVPCGPAHPPPHLLAQPLLFGRINIKTSLK